jgi:hypothetical protein
MTSPKILKLPPKSTNKNVALEYSPIKAAVKTTKAMTKKEFKVYNKCLNEINHAQRIKCKT